MIIRPHLRWFRMLLAWRGSVLPELLPRLCVILLISLVALGVHVHLLKISINMTTTPFSLIGIALAIFLGFRNSASYDRYWEARKLWGKLLNETRSLTRQVLTLPNAHIDASETQAFVQALCAFAHALSGDRSGGEPGGLGGTAAADRADPPVARAHGGDRPSDHR